MGALFFARHYAHFNVAKVASFQKLLQAHFPEPEPVLRVKLPRLLDIVFEQIQHNDTAISQSDGARDLFKIGLSPIVSY